MKSYMTYKGNANVSNNTSAITFFNKELCNYCNKWGMGLLVIFRQVFFPDSWLHNYRSPLTTVSCLLYQHASRELCMAVFSTLRLVSFLLLISLTGGFSFPCHLHPPLLLRPMKVFTSSELYPGYFWLLTFAKFFCHYFFFFHFIWNTMLFERTFFHQAFKLALTELSLPASG